MSTITTLNSADSGSVSLGTINTNFTNLNTDKQEKGAGVTGNLPAFGASNVLSDTGKVAPTGVIVGTTDAQTLTNKTLTTPVINGTPSGTFVTPIANGGTGQVTAQAAVDAILPSQTANSGKALTTNGTTSSWVSFSQAKFGGTGTDGALTITSGTTTINLANAAVVTKNYTSISITGTGKLAFINPNTNGSIVILKSQGAVTLTSSTAPMLDVSSLGAQGGVGATGVGAGVIGYAPTATVYIPATAAGAGGGTQASNAGGVGGVSAQSIVTTGKSIPMVVGAGGGGGGGGNSGGQAGSNGGGGLYIECGGAWNFTTASGISANGAAGVAGSTNIGASGGGGGGFVYVLYTVLTANSGTITVAAGGGGSAGAGNSCGGGGGASQTTSGSAGGGANGSGGGGGNGWSSVAANTDFA